MADSVPEAGCVDRSNREAISSELCHRWMLDRLCVSSPQVHLDPDRGQVLRLLPLRVRVSITDYNATIL